METSGPEIDKIQNINDIQSSEVKKRILGVLRWQKFSKLDTSSGYWEICEDNEC